MGVEINVCFLKVILRNSAAPVLCTLKPFKQSPDSILARILDWVIPVIILLFFMFCPCMLFTEF